METIMNTKAVSSTKPILNLDHPLANKTLTLHSNLCIPLNSQMTKSRISIGNRSRRCRSRVKAQVQTFYEAAETTETLYDLLGITEAVNSTEIKKAYKQMARKYHPDVSPPDRVDEYTNKFIMVHEAYETLSNPQTRALYDQDLARGFPFGNRSTHQNYYQGMDGREEWRTRWQSQLDGLKGVHVREDSTENMSWGARMRRQRDSR